MLYFNCNSIEPYYQLVYFQFQVFPVDLYLKAVAVFMTEQRRTGSEYTNYLLTAHAFYKKQVYI